MEAGLRSFNREMPEEHNRVLTDHCGDMLFCPTQNAVDNLQAEGITNASSPATKRTNSSANKPPRTVALVGDTMYDAVLQFSEIAKRRSTILEDLKIKPKEYLLATVHRAENTDDHDRLGNIMAALLELAEREIVVLPLHPRTRKILDADSPTLLTPYSSLKMIPPVGYLDMLMLEKNARIILTDSGGMQKEAYFFGVPCVTIRTETEWVETVEAGWNIVVGADRAKIAETIISFKTDRPRPKLYGDGKAAERIVRELAQHMC